MEIIRLFGAFLLLNLPLTIGGLMIAGYSLGRKLGFFNE